MTDRSDLWQTGEALQAKLFGDSESARPWHGQSDVGLEQLMSEICYGSIWTRPGLELRDRMLCTLMALCVARYLAQVRQHVGAALNIGIEPETIVEVFIQSGIYAGFPASEEALRAAKDVFAERGIAMPTVERIDPLPVLTSRGTDVMEHLHGNRSSQGYGSPDNPITSSLYGLVIQYCYGEIWERPGLDRRTRALCGVAAFTSLNLRVQLRKFVESARNVGATKTEIIEAIVQTGPYTGFAAALNALTDLSEVLSD